ncbi:MAG TPA: toxin TcdB middle/N-terminal domain-containing protein, partial [Flavobacteriaceae bacterium]|nr:toxin TcdB middle/N-terminal domain-containing protein [Flavobacteriaceae bacterium]
MGSNPQNYWWEITDANGYKSYYGGVNRLDRDAVLSATSNGGNIAKWALVRTEDPYGNYIEYTYFRQRVQIKPGVYSQEFYPKKITYTRHSDLSNYYEIEFIRDLYSAPITQIPYTRSDISTNGRFGFLTSTYSLLRQIDVRYVENSISQPVRYYTLHYNYDTYGHSLLNEIAEYDSDKKLFYSNTMEYYDEIVGHNTINDDSESWDIDEAKIKPPVYYLVNPALRGLLSSGSSLGASESYGFSAAGRFGVGIGTNPSNIWNTLGFGFNYSQNNQETKIDFIDINGDGLPDKIISKSSGVYYRPNTGNGFGNLQPILGVNNLSKTKSRSNGFSADANAFGQVGVGYSKNKTKSTTDYYFADFNGDGLPDLVANFGVRFNVTKLGGDYTMREFVTNNSDRTLNPIEAGDIAPEILDDIHFETLDELRYLFPQYDHVKMWTAPYKGTVNVSSSAKLLAVNDCEYSNQNLSNNFKLTLEKFTPTSTNEYATPITSITLEPSDLGQNRNFNQASIVIDKGDVLFFRIHNQEYGCGGEIEWNPKITYSLIQNIPSIVNENIANENGLLLKEYNSEEDFILHNGASWIPKEEATSVEVNFDLQSNRFSSNLITDDIIFKMEKIQTDNNTGYTQVVDSLIRTYHHKTKTFSGPNSRTDAINTTGNYSYSYHFSAESNSNIAWHTLKWKPTMTSMGQTETAPVSYSNFEKPLFESKYWIKASELPIVDSIPTGSEYTNYIKVKHDLVNMPTSLPSGFVRGKLMELEDNEALPLPVHWVVKGELNGEMQVLYKRTLYLIYDDVNDRIGFSTDADNWIDPTAIDTEFYLNRTQVQEMQQPNESNIYAGFYSSAEELALFNQTEVLFIPLDSIGQVPPPSTPGIKTIDTPFFAPEFNFSGVAYRGWREFLYNGGLLLAENDGEVLFDSNGNPIVLEDYGNDELRAKLLFESQYDGDNLEDLEDQLGEDDPDNLIGTAGEIVYSPYIQNPDDEQYNNASIQNAFYGKDTTMGTIIQGLGRFGTSNILEHYIDPQTLLNGTAGTFVGLKLFSRSKGETKSGNILGIEGTLSTGESINENQYIDLNGDGYPDLITKNSIQYTNMLGALKGKDSNMNNFIGNSKEEDLIGGATFAGVPPKTDNDGESSNNKTNTNINSGVNNSNGRSYDVSQWIDLNGDGLPDQVRITESGIFVSLNTGYGFLPETQWNTSISLNSTSTRVNFGMGMGGSFAPFPDTVDPDTGIVTINPSFGFGLGASISKARRNVQFSDVNGDGLPDLIYSELTSNQLKYYYQPNTGSGFHSTALLLFTDHIEEDQTLAANIYGTATAGFIIPIPFVTIKLTGTPTAGVNAALSEKTIRFQDIDGDGLPDVLSQKGSGTSIRVHRNRTGKTGLLKKVNTPLGGSWTIDYNREGNTYEMASSKWVLSKVRTHDGFTQDDNFDDANSETLTTFKYENGRYDRRDREFFGFEKVTTEERNPQSGSRYRYVVQEFLNTNYYTQGALKKQTTYDDDDNVLTQQKHYYNLIIPNQTHVANLNTDLNNPFQMFGLGELDRTRASLLLVKTTSTEYEDNQDQGRTLSQHFLKFDKYGNILSYENIGNSGSDAYLANITYDYGNAIFKRLPKNIEVRARRTNELLRKRKATYSNKGGLTSVTVFQEANKTSTILYGYDSFGNIISLTKQDLLGENGGSYNMKINYDNELQTYPVNINDSYSESSSTIYDYLFGVPVEITDKTGNKMRTRIDNRGRVIEITAPNEYGGSNSTGWTIRMEYQGEDIVANQLQSNNAQNTEYRFHTAQGEFKAIRPGSATPTDKQHYAVTRHNVLGAYQQELLTISIVDGLGKPIQLKKTHYSNGSLKWQVSGKEHTDVYGRAIYSYLPTIQQPYPTNINQLSNTDLEYDNQFSSLSPLATEYDVKDRPVWIQQPYEVDATDIFYSIQNNLAVTEVINELGQTQETHTDIRGRQVKTIQNNEITTSFYYNLVGELIRVHNNAGMDTKYYYNLGGLRIREEQPDRGVTNYTYDEAGRLTHKKTSNLDGQQEIEYQYNYDRLTAINYPLNPSQNVQYTYGSFGNDTGRIIEQRDAIGIQRFKYGKLGELIEQINAMAVAGKTSYWFKTQWEYDSWNRIKKIVYPDSEEVTYRYNQAGQLDSVTSAIPGVQAHNVVNGIEYNDYGERKSITYGNGTTTNYTYDNRRRLEQLDFDFTGFQQTREYRYDALSNILGIETISSTPPSTGVLGGPVHHTYKYDNYNRLVMAEGSYVGPDDYQPFMLKQEYSLQMSYDPSHSILSKTQNHKYGSVASVTDPLRNDALFAPTAYHLEYEDYNRGQFNTDGYAYTQPHAPRVITQYPVDNPNDPRDPRVEKQLLDYDARGNITQIEREINNPDMPMDTAREYVRKFVWDEEDRLLGVDLRPESPRNQPHIAAYTYDAGGERGIRYVPRQMGGVYSATQAGYAQD